MEYDLGKLEITSWGERTELLAVPVALALQSMSNAVDVGVTEIDPEVSDTTGFCGGWGVGREGGGNCIVREAKRAERTWFAACVVLAHTQADVNGLVRRTLDARRVSFAPMEQAVSVTGMEYGAITPVGLPSDWVILVDQRIIETPYIILGSGLRKSKLALPGLFLASLPNVQVVEGLAKERVQT